MVYVAFKFRDDFFGKDGQLPIFWKIWSTIAIVDLYVSHYVVVRELYWPIQGWHVSSHSLVIVTVLSSMHEWCFDTCPVILMSFVGCTFKIVQSFCSTVLWHIWCARNKFIFEGEWLSTDHVCKQAWRDTIVAGMAHCNNFLALYHSSSEDCKLSIIQDF